MDFGDCPRDFRIADASGHRAAARLRGAGTPPCQIKHRTDARTDPEQGRHETVVWIKRLREHAPLNGDKSAWRGISSDSVQLWKREREYEEDRSDHQAFEG